MSWQDAIKAVTHVLVEVSTGKRIKVGGNVPSRDDPPRETPFDAIKRGGSLPRKVDLRPHMTAVEDQSAVNSCASNAIVGIYEYLSKRAHGDSGDISRLFVYYNARRYDGIRGDRGSSMTSNIRVLQELGACTEETWPYNPRRVDTRPDEESYTEAKRFMLQEASRIPVNLHAMRACLAAGYPFAFGLVLFKSFDRAGRSGIVPVPDLSTAVGRKTHGCHAMLCVGYSDQDQHFVVRNSWGTRWGNRGYCYIPYAYMANPKLCADCWTIRDVSDLDFTPGEIVDDGFDVDYEIDEDEAPMYVFEAAQASADAIEAAMAGAVSVLPTPVAEDDEDDDYEDEDEDYDEDEGGSSEGDSSELLEVRVGCGGLQDPDQVNAIIATFMSLVGVEEVYFDHDELIAFVTLNPALMTADDLWNAISQNGVIQPAWID